MPFRDSTNLRNLLEKQRRTGEPSPSTLLYLLQSQEENGHGKAQGSHTEKARLAFREWRTSKGFTYSTLFTLDYRLSRKKIVTLSGHLGDIYHDPNYGRGTKGFVLSISILSINGTPYHGPSKVWRIAWNRIIGHGDILHLLPKPN